MKTHREIADQMELFHSEPEAPGMIFWHANGWRLFRKIQSHMRNVYERAGFSEIRTPQFLKKELWQTSGHWQKFLENMFVGGDNDAEPEYALKPMSCPAHIMHFRRGKYSYRDLPFRVFEFGTVHRNEPSGSLNGCLRLRQFTQDDAHVFCDWSQAEAEIHAFLERAKQVYSDYGYEDIGVKVSTKPDDAFGADDDWRKAENILASACRAAGYAFEYQVGEGAFYGPKIEISLQDAMGREWQCGTIQLDFNLPERFDIHYVRENNQFSRPVILHQAMYGSLERWIGILLESYQGKLAPWIHPVPVGLASVNRDAAEYASAIAHKFQEARIPLMPDVSDNTIARKIKRFHECFVPYVLVVGEQEVRNGTVSFRQAASKKSHQLDLDELVEFLWEKLTPPDKSLTKMVNY